VLVHVELATAVPRMAEALGRVRRWQDLRSRLARITVPGSAGTDPSVGALLRERAPAERPTAPTDRPTRIDELLDLIATVESTEGGEAEWTKLRDWCWLWRPWLRDPRRPAPRRGPRQLVAYWLAVGEVVDYLRVRHRGWDEERLDGHVSWRLVEQVLRALGWAVRATPRKLREDYAAWCRTVPTVLGHELPTARVGGLRFVVEPARDASAEPRPRHSGEGVP
jgi:hypothetical protein